MYLPEFCAHRLLQTLSANGQQATAGPHIVHISSADIHAPLPHQTSLAQHKLKDKIIKNVKIRTAEL